MFDTSESLENSTCYGGCGAGRDDDGQALHAVETWNPLTGAWTEREGLPVARVGHTASLLPGGQVLLL
jgi:hypothetical protein